MRWKFPDIFPDTIRGFAQPLVATPLSRMAAVMHLAVWRAAADELNLDADARAASVPAEVATALGLGVQELLDMPGLAELSAGLEEMIH